MAFEKYATDQLKKTSKLFLILSIIVLSATVLLQVFGIYKSTQDDSKTILILVLTVLGPLAIFLSLLVSVMGAEVKKREISKP